MEKAELNPARTVAVRSAVESFSRRGVHGRGVPARGVPTRGVPGRGVTRVERFDRRGSEPFELCTSEFGQNSVRIQCILLEISKISGFNMPIYQHFRKY